MRRRYPVRDTAQHGPRCGGTSPARTDSTAGRQASRLGGVGSGRRHACAAVPGCGHQKVARLRWWRGRLGRDPAGQRGPARSRGIRSGSRPDPDDLGHRHPAPHPGAGLGSADALWELISTTSPAVDRAVYTDPVFRSAFRRAINEAFSQGPAGYARDTVLAMGRWPFDPGRHHGPGRPLYGRQDTSPVHSPDLSESPARRILTASRHSLPDAGGSLIWTHGEAVLRALAAHVRRRRGCLGAEELGSRGASR